MESNPIQFHQKFNKELIQFGPIIDQIIGQKSNQKLNQIQANSTKNPIQNRTNLAK